VPRTFGASHPLADHLRLTVRDRDGNDRLIEAAAAIEAGARAPTGMAADAPPTDTPDTDQEAPA
jgi:hypothetical protein